MRKKVFCIFGNTRFLNLFTGLICQVAAAVLGLVIPNLILKTYGSVLNGFVSTVTQMLVYLSFVEMGLASASLVSLYKPMAEKNYSFASEIFSAINRFYCRIAIIFFIGSIGCGFIVMFLIKDDISLSTIWLVVISLAGSNFISYWFLSKYRVLVTADDKLYVINTIQTIGYFLQFVLSIIIIRCKVNIAFTKGILIVIYLVEWFLLISYCRRHLPDITFKVTPKTDAIQQRKDILVHQVASLVLNNTDVLVLTVFSPSLSIVSIYTVYEMVATLIQRVALSIIGMFSAKMGQLYSISEYEEVRRLLSRYEFIYDISLFTLYGCMAILIMPFISIYTKGVNDTNYYIPIIGLLFSIYGIIRNIRMPYTELTNAAGHFKQTRILSFTEAGLNLAVSLLLVSDWGIIGVLMGTLVGEIYRTMHSCIYCYKNILTYDWIRSLLLTVGCTVVFIIQYLLLGSIRETLCTSYWVFIKISVIVCVFIFLSNFVICFFTEKSYETYKKEK